MAIAGKVAITLATENGGAWSADVTYDRLVAVKHNNNLYISRKVVTNVEPPNDEFWFLALEGYSGEDVQVLIDRMNAIISGTQQVGNAKTLDGHGAEFFAHSADLANYIKFDGSNAWVSSVNNLNNFYTGITVVRYCENVPNDNWWLVISGGEGGTIVQTAYHLQGIETPKQRYCAGGSWSEWFDLNKDYIKHTEKPSGTYTGNGDATRRGINIGAGIGDTLLIRSVNGFAIVYDGAVAFSIHTSPNLQPLNGGEVGFDLNSRTLYMLTGNVCLNAVGVEYKWYVL